MSRISYFAGALAERIPPVPGDLKTSVPSDYQDDPSENTEGGLGFAEGQSFIIEYVNAAGKSSTRRITVYDIVTSAGGVPSLMARCHERQATRQFRIDRIASCIDYNGEVFDDVSGFLVDTFGMSAELAGREASDENEHRWKAIIEYLRPMAILLAAVSRSDGQVRSVELETSAQRLAMIAERRDLWIEDENYERLVNYIRRLRPDAEAIGRALGALSKADKDDIIAFFRAAVAVMKADGVHHPEEVKIINDMAVEIVGVEVL